MADPLIGHEILKTHFFRKRPSFSMGSRMNPDRKIYIGGLPNDANKYFNSFILIFTQVWINSSFWGGFCFNFWIKIHAAIC